MNRPILTAIATALFIAASLAEDPPTNMQQHFKWCGSAKTVSESLARYEGFWREYCPASDGGVRATSDGDGYGDAAHIMHVRLSAYRLLKLYFETGNRDKAAYYLNWIEKTDPVIGVAPGKNPERRAK
jgi:cellulase/cellobiase CelA1